MVPMKTTVALFALVALSAAKPPGGGHVPSPGEVDAAIVNINLHYNDKLCLELLLVDCATHVTQGDEMVCGSDGITYANHCVFTHAMCEFLHSDVHDLKINHRGACTTATGSTMPPATVALGSTMAPAQGSTMPPATAAQGSTMAPATATQGSTMAPVTTTVAVTTTSDPIGSIVQNVFCQNVATISCGSTFEILCGSDGQFYPNQCELSKQKCQDPTLTVADKSTCPISG